MTYSGLKLQVTKLGKHSLGYLGEHGVYPASPMVSLDLDASGRPVGLTASTSDGGYLQGVLVDAHDE